MKRPRGFAMLTVLWVMVAAAAIAAAGAVAGVDASTAHKNRINATRARWRAQSCANRARYAVNLVLAETAEPARDSAWRALDSLVAAVPGARDEACDARLVAAGSGLNVNTATEDDLDRLFTALGLTAPQQLAAAVSDWIDADDFPRQMGAEAAAYASLERRGPRNGPVAAVEELRYVIGLEAVDLDSVLTVDSARISLANAPLTVLAVLPGFGTEVLSRIAEWRAIGRQVTNLLVLGESVSPTANAAIINAYPEITRRTTIDPEAWFIRATGIAGSPQITATVELKLVRAQTRAVVMRTREW